MTSNMGSSIIEEKFKNIPDMDAAAEVAKIEVLSLLKQTVRPEFINRIDDIVLFTPLTKTNIKAIVKIQLENVKKMIQKQHINIEATEEAISLLAEKGFDPAFGARPVKRVIQKLVLNQLSKEILSGNVTTNSNILLDAFEDELVFRN
jgi:ATP-dependent Clp protease ATP-binding subunit ClpB